MPLGKVRMGEIAKTAETDEFELVEARYRFEDLIISQETAMEIKSLISLKRDYDFVFQELGFSSTHREHKKFVVNFYGEPGTGKTVTAHAFAREFDKKLLIVDYSQIESKYVGDTPKNLKRVFEFARKKDCIIFFDEADAILSRRVSNMQNATDTSVNQTRSVMLNILNDFQGDLIFATNFISNYDPAFMRRISKHIYFSLPDSDARILLFKKYIPPSIHVNIDFTQLSHEAEGLSAADIENSTLMTGFDAASRRNRIISTADFKRQINNIKHCKKQNSSEMKLAEAQHFFRKHDNSPMEEK